MVKKYLDGTMLTSCLSLFTKPAYQIFESSTSIKNARVKSTVFKLLGIGITSYGQAFGKKEATTQCGRLVVIRSNRLVPL
jgi:hypothetical protein